MASRSWVKLDLGISIYVILSDTIGTLHITFNNNGPKRNHMPRFGLRPIAVTCHVLTRAQTAATCHVLAWANRSHMPSFGRGGDPQSHFTYGQKKGGSESGCVEFQMETILRPSIPLQMKKILSL